MEEWRTYKLGDLLTIKYGKDHKALSDGPYAVYGSGGIMRYVERPIYDKASILIPRKGSLNNVMYVDKPFWTVDTMFWTIINTEIVLPHFLFYSIRDIDFAGLNVGSAVPSLTCPVIEAIKVQIPSIETQIRILGCLEPIDKKIELNNRINHNLEEQAKALFKSWFIDFEPFKDGAFIDSELGLIPEGWKIVGFKSFLTTTNEKAYVEDLPEYSVTNNGIIPREKKFNKTLSKSTSKNKVLRKDNLVFGMSREILNWGIMEDEIGGVSSAYNIYEIDKKIIAPLYLRLFMTARLSYFNDLIGTAAREGQSLDKGALFQKEVYVPPVEIYSSFLNVYMSVIGEQDNIKQEVASLIKLRDELLPHLLKGDTYFNLIDL